MDADHLVDMVNDIANFFASAADDGKAPAEVASHLRRFWEPRMQREIVAAWRAKKAGFSDLGRAAVALLAEDTPAKG